MRARRSQSRISRAGAEDRSAADGRRRGMGRLPGRERLQLLERAAKRVHRRGEGDPEVSLSLGAESGAGGEKNSRSFEDTTHEVHRAFVFGDASPEIEGAAGRPDGATQATKRIHGQVPPLAIDAAKRRAVDPE